MILWTSDGESATCLEADITFDEGRVVETVCGWSDGESATCLEADITFDEGRVVETVCGWRLRCGRVIAGRERSNVRRERSCSGDQPCDGERMFEGCDHGRDRV